MSRPQDRRFEWVRFAALLGVALGLRLYHLNHFGFWLDEILQSYWVHGTWSFFWKSLRFDAFHPPLDYLISKILCLAHAPDDLLKIPAVVWGVGTVAALGILVARRVDRAAGVVAVVLLAAAPFHVRYSQELRPYSLGLFLLCLSLCLLDAFLERPTAARLLGVFLASLATLYSLYVAAIVLAIAAASLLIEDAFGAEPARRAAARRFLPFSPLFGAALWVAYLPWWPVVISAARRAPMAAAEPVTWDRLLRTLSFFSFAMNDGERLGRVGALYVVLCVVGVILLTRRRGARFFVAWGLAGLAVLEALGQMHPHMYATRRFLPAGLALTVFAAVAIAGFLRKPATRLIAVALMAAILAADLRTLGVYYREGRADWRPLAEFLKANSSRQDRVFVESQYQQLSLAYYLVGPTFLFDLEERGTMAREVYGLGGRPILLSWSWEPGKTAWLLMSADDSEATSLGRWAKPFPVFPFPTAESSMLYRLDPAFRERAFSSEGLALLDAKP